MRRHVWIFDLDNTLHHASAQVFPQINRQMTAYLQTALGLDEVAASALRQDYWHRYGATLLGLMRHHGVDPRHFLDQTHRLPELARMLVRERGLRRTLRRLKGPKVVFSNAPLAYAGRVLDALGIRSHFDGVFCIEHTRFRPKPDVHGFLRLLRRHRLAPRRCIMVEDSLDNLRTAKRLGMKTVWLARRASGPALRRARVSAYVDLVVRSLLELSRRAPQLL